MEKDMITDKGDKSAQELSTFLRTVADKIDEGSLTLTRGGDSLTLEFPEQFGFRFKVKDDITRSGTHRKVQIGFRWWLDQRGEKKTAGGMVIS